MKFTKPGGMLPICAVILAVWDAVDGIRQLIAGQDCGLNLALAVGMTLVAWYTWSDGE